MSKIREAHDLIEGGKYKDALKIIQNVLDKKKGSGPDLPVLNALKARVFERLGRTEEAIVLCDEVKKKIPTDPYVLKTLSTIYQSVGKKAEATQVYVQAWDANPDDQDCAKQVFMAYIREDNYPKLQSFCTQMFRKSNNPNFYFGGMQFNLMQVQGSGPNKLVDLVEKMLEKSLADGKIVHYEILMMFLNVLERQKKFERSLELLESPLSELFKEKREFLDTKGRILMSLERWVEAREIYVDLVTNLDRDGWEFYENIISSSLALLRVPMGAKASVDVEGLGISEADWDTAISFCIDLFKSLQESTPELEKRRCRAPFIAELEILSRVISLRALHHPSPLIQRFEESLTAYVDRYHTLSSCATDIKRHLRRLTPSHLLTLRQSLFDSAQPEPKRLVTVRRLQRVFGFHKDLQMDVNGSRALASSLVKEYITIVKEDTPAHSSERAYGEELLSLAASVLLDLYRAHRDPRDLVDVITLLQQGLLRSKHNFEFCVLLLRAFLEDGAVVPASAMFQQLDIKHILIDSLLYILFQPALDYCSLSVTKNLIALAKKFELENERETPEHVYGSILFGSFTKISEIAEIKRKLDSSISLKLCEATRIKLGVMDRSASVLDTLGYLRANTSILPASKGDLLSISDNRDFNVLPNFDTIEDEDAETENILRRKRGDLASLFSDSILLALLIPAVFGESRSGAAASGDGDGLAILNTWYESCEHIVGDLAASSPPPSPDPSLPKSILILNRWVSYKVFQLTVRLRAGSFGEEADAINVTLKEIGEQIGKVCETATGIAKAMYRNKAEGLDPSSFPAALTDIFLSLAPILALFFSFCKTDAKSLKIFTSSISELKKKTVGALSTLQAALSQAQCHCSEWYTGADGPSEMELIFPSRSQMKSECVRELAFAREESLRNLNDLAKKSIDRISS